VAKQQKAADVTDAPDVKPAADVKADDPIFGITFPAPGGTVGTTALVAYGWCANITAATHTIKCVATKTPAGGVPTDYPVAYATLYCGDPPTLWQVTIPTTNPALTSTDALKFTATLIKTSDSSVAHGPITRAGLTVDANAVTPTPTLCSEDIYPDPELELEAPTLPLPVMAPDVTAGAKAKARFKTEQFVSFSFRPRRRVRSARAVLARASDNGRLVKVLAVIPAVLSGSSLLGPDRCEVFVPVPKKAEVDGGKNYVVEVILLNENGVRVGSPHREMLGRSRG